MCGVLNTHGKHFLLTALHFCTCSQYLIVLCGLMGCMQLRAAGSELRDGLSSNPGPASHSLCDLKYTALLCLSFQLKKGKLPHLSCWELIRESFYQTLQYGSPQSELLIQSPPPSPPPLKIQPVLWASKFTPTSSPNPPFPNSLKGRYDLPFSKYSDHCLYLFGHL